MAPVVRSSVFESADAFSLRRRVMMTTLSDQDTRVFGSWRSLKHRLLPSLLLISKCVFKPSEPIFECPTEPLV